MSTIKLTPKVAAVPTEKVLKFFNKELSTLLHQSIFWHCENHAVDDGEVAITFRDNDYVISLSIQPVEMPTEWKGYA